ncbi:MAG: GNAT family N-acetyltransferase [Rhizomicrobium sp.]
MLEEIRRGDALFGQMVAALEAAHLPTDDLAEGNARYYAMQGGAFGGIVNVGGVAMLRSMIAKTRGNGDGTKLLDAMLRQAKADRFEEAWLLTNTAEGFFAKHGFERMDRKAAPEALKQTRQFSSLCPDSAALMRRRLT